MANNKSLDLKDIINVATALSQQEQSNNKNQSIKMVSALSSLVKAPEKEEEEEEKPVSSLLQAAKTDAKDTNIISNLLYSICIFCAIIKLKLQYILYIKTNKSGHISITL